ncbi:MAG TPA: hypothetical protein VI653_03080 [Steroidobacteraceae bacterium]
MSFSSGRHFATGLVMIASGVLLYGCLSSRGAPRIETMVRAEPSGLNLVFADVGGRSRIVIEVHDYTGTSEQLSWQIPNIQLTPAYKQLIGCIEAIRAKDQAPDKSAYSQPYYLRNAALRCIENSGMPPPEVIAGSVATEYRVSITIGILRARRRLRLTPASARSVPVDVDECMRAAEDPGVGIQSLLARFDVCLRSRSYLVDDAPRARQSR